ncbi:carboxypeptidase M-like isoform X4 [Sinocyclocheilus grahami]|uniref:carboxypeptidase M-like isoform X4 n=1 Tax=Sinocyclocheilus grahami TaxID=75366 RepID=UPI0007AD2D97|nr:PREDICTED: carboxypeptidase M-like isoform X4 [Sinocyclocheilus grahami]
MDSFGKPVQNAVVEVAGRRNVCPFRTDRNGEYYRLLLPGNYTIKGHAQTSTSDTPPTPKMMLQGCSEGHPMQYEHIVLMSDGQLITRESEDM